MSIGSKMVDAIKVNLGWELADNLRAVGNNKPHVIDCNETNCIVTCVEDDKPYIEAMQELIDNDGNYCKIIVKQQSGARMPRGNGFGHMVWRKNTKHDGIELSFNGKPDDKIREAMKSLGFRWSHISGVWYISNKKFSEPVKMFLNGAGFTQVEDN